jgi:hypothetical protein
MGEWQTSLLTGLAVLAASSVLGLALNWVNRPRWATSGRLATIVVLAVAAGVIIPLVLPKPADSTAEQKTPPTSSSVDTQLPPPQQPMPTDPFDRATLQLAADSIDLRLAGIYALEQLAHDEPARQPTIITTLSAFVREHARDAEDPQCVEHEAPGDIQAVLTVLGRRVATSDGGAVIDLNNSCLANTNLASANLAGADVFLSNWTKANLQGTDLSSANGIGCVFTDAALSSARFVATSLTGADFTRADLSYTDLTDANPGQANFTGSDLTDATLTGTGLYETNFAGVTWTVGTRWPSEHVDRVRGASSEAGGVFTVGELLLSDG